jgi:hypothetical protein
MNHDGHTIAMRGRYRPDGAGPLAGAGTTKMPLLMGMGGRINNIRLFHENDARFLKQF